MKKNTLIIAMVLLALSSYCLTVNNSPYSDHMRTDLDAYMNGLLNRYNISSIAVGVLKNKELALTRAYGISDQEAQTPATPDTIYSIASCSKPIVGLAAAMMLKEQADKISLDSNLADHFEWLQHKKYPQVPVTLRHLVTHRSGLISDGPCDYENNPKPEPDKELEPFMLSLIKQKKYWLNKEPGEAESYSNLGAALVGLIVQKISDQAFNEFCTDRIFNPLGMNDTRWFLREFTEEQKSRIARPHDEDKEPYEHYAYNDYPSGLLRTTIKDFSTFLIMLMNNGQHGSNTFLSQDTISLFKSVPMLIFSWEQDDHMSFDHSGGDLGVNTYFTFSDNGSGYLFFINSDLDENVEDKLIQELDTRLMIEMENL